MRRVELGDQSVKITLTGLTMVEALQGRIEIPYGNISTVHPQLRVPPHLLRVGGTSLGPMQEGHYVGDSGWYFLSYENPDRVLTLNLDGFYLGRQPYCAVAIEVDDPETMAEAIRNRLDMES